MVVGLESSPTFSLKINVTRSVFRQLKENQYKLCVARKINDKYSVVWFAISDFLPTTVVRWKDDWEIYGASLQDDEHIDGMGVDDVSRTNLEPIGLGQDIEVDANGLLQHAKLNETTKAHRKGFRFTNKHLPLRVGLNSSVLISGKRRCLPVWIAPSLIARGSTLTITPSNEFCVWFAPDVQAGTILTNFVEPTKADPPPNMVFPFSMDSSTRSKRIEYVGGPKIPWVDITHLGNWETIDLAHDARREDLYDDRPKKRRCVENDR